jgi:hypothetical protein
VAPVRQPACCWQPRPAPGNGLLFVPVKDLEVFLLEIAHDAALPIAHHHRHEHGIHLHFNLGIAVLPRRWSRLLRYGCGSKRGENQAA